MRFDVERPRPSAAGSIVTDIARDFGRFVASRDNQVLLVIGLGSALGASRLDRAIATSPFNEHRNGPAATWVDGFFEPGSVLGGGTTQLTAALAAWSLGAGLDRPELAGLGRDLVRAQIVAQGVTHALKRSVRRMRPDGSSTKSFPSGHAAGIFATATVLERHYGWKVGAPAYGAAAYVAASRINENRHYLSDVLFGAAIGLAAGRTVTFGMGAARVELSPLVAAGGGGFSVAIGR